MNCQEDSEINFVVKEGIAIPADILSFKFETYDCEYQAKGAVTHNGNTYTQYELIIPDLDV